MRKLLLKITTLLLVVILSIYFCIIVSEKFFFDRLFYQKSCVYGYQSKDSFQCKGFLRKLIDDRTADTTMIFSEKIEMPTDQVNIALLGDSFVYGLGVKNDERFGKILENKLSEIKPTKVWNLGLQNDHVVDNLAKYLYLKENYKIDIFIFTVLHNDLYIDSLDRYKNSENVYKLLTDNCEGENYNVADDGQHPEVLLYQLLPKFNNSCLYSQAMSLISRGNEEVIIFFYDIDMAKDDKDIAKKYSDFFSTYDIGEYKYYSYPILQRFFYQEAQNRLLHTLDISSIWKNEWPTVSQKEWHPSIKAHQIFAKSLFQEIIKNNIYLN